MSSVYRRNALKMVVQKLGSQVDVARALGKSLQQLNQLLNSKRNIGDRHTVEIENKLDLEPETLILPSATKQQLLEARQPSLGSEMTTFAPVTAAINLWWQKAPPDQCRWFINLLCERLPGFAEYYALPEKQNNIVLPSPKHHAGTN